MRRKAPNLITEVRLAFAIPDYEIPVAQSEVPLMEPAIFLVLCLVMRMSKHDIPTNSASSQHLQENADRVNCMIESILAVDDIEAVSTKEQLQVFAKSKNGAKLRDQIMLR